MMKKVFLTAMAAVVLTGMGNWASAAPAADSGKTETAVKTAKPTWLTRFNEAQEMARKEKKAIFVDFTGSDWCPWCVRLHDEILTKKSFLDYAAKNLVLLMVDFPRRKPLTSEQKQANEALAQKYGIQGFPTILLLDSEGNVIAKTGYRRGGAEPYVRHLQNLLKR